MNDSSIRSGTLVGTLFTLIGFVSFADIERTVVLGGIGAAVSFLVSWLLKRLISYGKDQLGTGQEL